MFLFKFDIVKLFYPLEVVHCDGEKTTSSGREFKIIIY